MTCFECGGQIVRTTTSFIMYDSHGKPIFFEEVPANECTQCGEKYLDGQTVNKIEQVMRDGSDGKKEIKVPVKTLAA
jgi:YgiT-type zinc finger domain-containing protein